MDDEYDNELAKMDKLEKDYLSFGSTLAMVRGMVTRGRPMKVFDWDRAAELIKSLNIQNARAGLLEDWGFTSGMILLDGKPLTQEQDVFEDTYTYLASTWATPVLEDTDQDNIYLCWIGQENTEWDAKTVWPPSALAILDGTLIEGTVVKKEEGDGND